jgi:hypothetical protein
MKPLCPVTDPEDVDLERPQGEEQNVSSAPGDGCQIAVINNHPPDVIHVEMTASDDYVYVNSVMFASKGDHDTATIRDAGGVRESRWPR